MAAEARVPPNNGCALMRRAILSSDLSVLPAAPAGWARLGFTVLDIALIAGCAALTALLVWDVAGRATGPVAVPGSDRAAGAGGARLPDSLTLTAFDMFNRADAPANRLAADAMAPATTLDLQLFGVRAEGADGAGSAIIRRPDGSQDAFMVGQSVIDGVVLAAVRADHVVLSRGGVRESLPFPNAKIADDMSPAGPVGVRPQASPPSGQLLAAIAVERGANGEVLLKPGRDAALFAAAGFQPGDRLTHINGRPVESVEDLPSLVESLDRSQEVVLAVNRGGVAATITLAPERGA
ncbi:MAG: type II secretion system protein N [Rhodospirillaceae bacterium]|nr:type II secretion system protein N [Rhodospirillaceae bacterium]